MRNTLIGLILLLAVNVSSGQSHQPDRSVHVKFALDGKTLACNPVRVEFLIAGRHVVPESTPNGFIVPAELMKPQGANVDHDPTRTDVQVSCDNYTLSFQSIGSMVTPGYWEVGIAYPPYTIERYRRSAALESGMWVSYLESECFGCDPGAVTLVSQKDVPEPIRLRLLRDQSAATGSRAVEIAYALAVFKVDYQKNRDFLVNQLRSCFAKPDWEDVCNSTDLLDYITHLYWRGDSELLRELLIAAGERSHVVLELGDFFADALERRTSEIVAALRETSPEKQQTVGRLAGDGFSLNKPQQERSVHHLRAIGGDVAVHCAAEAEKAANSVPWRRAN